jgi:hypothetical protein
MWKLFKVVKCMRSTNDCPGLNKGKILVYILLLVLTVVSSGIFTIIMYKFYDYESYIIALSFEYGVDTLLQFMIGYICATMGTDTSMEKFRILLLKIADGAYEIIFEIKKDIEQKQENEVAI